MRGINGASVAATLQARNDVLGRNFRYGFRADPREHVFFEALQDSARVMGGPLRPESLVPVARRALKCVAPGIDECRLLTLSRD